MEVTNAEILASSGPLQILSGMVLPVLVSFQIAKLAVKLHEPLVVVENVFNKLVITYGETQKGGEMAVIGPDDFLRRPVSPNWDKFVAERDKLLSQTVELNVEKVQLPTMIDGKPLQIAPRILIALERFISIDGTSIEGEK